MRLSPHYRRVCPTFFMQGGAREADLKFFGARFAIVFSVTLLVSSGAQAARPHISWQGIYGGFYLGGDWASGNAATTDIFKTAFPVPAGLAGGGLLGLNLASDSLVFGLESDLALPDLTRSSCVQDLDCADAFGREFTGSVRGRVGIAVDRVLIYGTAGYAFSNLSDYSLGWRDDSPTVFQKGWTAGAGIEFALGDHARTGLEYRSTFYDPIAAAGTHFQPRSNEVMLRLTFH